MSSLLASYDAITRSKTAQLTSEELANRNGTLYSSDLSASIPTGTSVEFIIQTGDIDSVDVYDTSLLTTSGDLDIELFSGAEFTGGTPVVVRSRNLKLSVPETSLLKSSPTVSVDGTLVLVGKVLGDNSTKEAVQFPNSRKFTLAPNTIYLLRLTHNAVSTKDVAYGLLFSENK